MKFYTTVLLAITVASITTSYDARPVAGYGADIATGESGPSYEVNASENYVGDPVHHNYPNTRYSAGNSYGYSKTHHCHHYPYTRNRSSSRRRSSARRFGSSNRNSSRRRSSSRRYRVGGYGQTSNSQYAPVNVYKRSIYGGDYYENADLRYGYENDGEYGYQNYGYDYPGYDEYGYQNYGYDYPNDGDYGYQNYEYGYGNDGEYGYGNGDYYGENYRLMRRGFDDGEYFLGSTQNYYDQQNYDYNPYQYGYDNYDFGYGASTFSGRGYYGADRRLTRRELHDYNVGSNTGYYYPGYYRNYRANAEYGNEYQVGEDGEYQGSD